MTDMEQNDQVSEKTQDPEREAAWKDVRTVWATVLASGKPSPMTSLRGEAGEEDEAPAWRRSLPMATLAAMPEEDLSGRTMESRDAEELSGRTMEGQASPPAPRADQGSESLAGRTLEEAFNELASLGGATMAGDREEDLLLGEKTRKAPAASPARRTEEFHIENRIAGGGMGDVFIARQVGLNRSVALKRPLPGMMRSAGKLNAFVREAVVTGDLEHPNIVPIYQNGVDTDGIPYYAMKLVRGIEWKFLLHPKLIAARKDPALEKTVAEKSAAMTLADHVEILLKVCDAIAYAHSRGVLHRDLKPENVMVGEFGEVQLMDWGLAVDFREDAARAGKAISRLQIKGPAGTPSYMAPEMALGKVEKIGPRTDVYLLGSVLYELLTGRPPHHCKTLEQSLLHSAMNTFKRPEKANPEAPHGLCEIAVRALSAEPEDRQASAQALQDEIRQYQKHAMSMQISDQAASDLDRLGHEEARDKGEAEARYVRYAEVVGAYQQALRLWDGNEDARLGLREAYLAFIKNALAGGDLGLARAQIDEYRKIAGARDRDLAELQAQCKRLDAQRRLRQQRYRLAIRAAALLAILVVVGGVWSWIRIKAEKDRVVSAQDDTVAARIVAETNAERAVQKADEAEKARQAAVEQRQLADKAAREAEEARKKEEEARKSEETQRKMVEQQRHRAEAGEASARKSADEAKLAQTAAETEKKNAVTSLAMVDIERARFLMDGDRDYPYAARHLLKAIRVMGGLEDSIEPRRILAQLMQASPRLVRTVALPQPGKDVQFAADGKDPLRILLENGAAWKEGDAVSASAIKDARAARSWAGRAMVVGRDGRLYENGAPATLEGMKDWQVSALAADASGVCLVVGGRDGRIAVFNAATAPKQAFSTVAHHGVVTAAAFLGTADEAATAGADGRLCVWDLAGSKLQREVRAHAGFVSSLAVSADGRAVATAGAEGVIRVWNAASLTEKVSLVGHSREVGALAFHPSRTWLASQSWDGTVRLWDWNAKGEGKAACLHVPAGGDRLAVAFSIDGNRLACLSGIQAAQVWDVSDRIDVTPAPWRNLRLAEGRLAGQTAGRIVLAGRQENWLLPAAGAPERSPERRGIVWAGPAGPRGDRYVTALDDGGLRWWGEDKNSAALPARIAAASQRGKMLVLVCADGAIFDVRLDADEIKPASVCRVAQAAGAAVSEDGLIAVWNAAGELYTNAGGEVVKVEVEGGRRVRQAGWRPGRRDLLIQAPARELLVVDAQSGKVLRQWHGHDAHVSALAFDRTGRWAASGDDNGEVRLWDLQGADAGASTVLASGLNLRVRDLLIDEGGARVACMLDDSTVRLFALPEPIREPDMQALHGMIKAALGVDPSPDEGPTAVRNP
jgi:serine/threonine protein kinase/WD40 repeat protein